MHACFQKGILSVHLHPFSLAVEFNSTCPALPMMDRSYGEQRHCQSDHKLVLLAVSCVWHVSFNEWMNACTCMHGGELEMQMLPPWNNVV
jgi:hypothetical protein